MCSRNTSVSGCYRSRSARKSQTCACTIRKHSLLQYKHQDIPTRNTWAQPAQFADRVFITMDLGLPPKLSFSWPTYCIECDILARWQWKLQSPYQQQRTKTWGPHLFDRNGSIRCAECASGYGRPSIQSVLESCQIVPETLKQPVVKCYPDDINGQTGLSSPLRPYSSATSLGTDTEVVIRGRNEFKFSPLYVVPCRTGTSDLETSRLIEKP